MQNKINQNIEPKPPIIIQDTVPIILPTPIRVAKDNIRELLFPRIS